MDNNNNELCLAGEITEIILDKPNVKKFVLKTKGFEILCTAFPGDDLSIGGIKKELKCYVQGNIEARRWTNTKGYEVLENRFTINKII